MVSLREGCIRTSRGFSLGEVLVAMFVLVVGIAGVTSSLWWASDHADSGKLQTEAANQARAIYESIVAESMIAEATAVSSGNWPDGTYGLVDLDPATRTPLLAFPFDRASLPYFQVQAKGQSNETLTSGNTGSSDELSSDLSRFTRNITLERKVSTGTVDAYLDQLAILTVRIFWNEKGHERQIEIRGVIQHHV